MAEDKNLLIIENREIQDMIYTIRDKQVMMDSDLAILYQVETKHLNRQRSRNADRFPEDFCFQLSKEECEILRCQNVTSKKKKVVQAAEDICLMYLQSRALQCFS